MSDEPNKQDVDEGQAAAALLEGALERMGLQTSVEARVEGRFLRLDVSGPDAEELVTGGGASARSNVLDALQMVLSRSLRAEAGRTVVIDAAGFRDQRLDQLDAAATRLGDFVQTQTKPARVHGMNSFDRRAIHLALKERRDIRTDSEGEGVFRVITISPVESRQDD